MLLHILPCATEAALIGIVVGLAYPFRCLCKYCWERLRGVK
jgi:hypothetical protein